MLLYETNVNSADAAKLGGMEFIAIIVLVGAGWFWLGSLKTREIALLICRNACLRANVQLLDETVALKRLDLARDQTGRVHLRRRYQFEYSEQGLERRQGEIILLGNQLLSIRGDWIESQATTGPGPASVDPESNSDKHRHIPSDSDRP